MTTVKVSIRLDAADLRTVQAIREHLRRTRPWANRTDVLRFALHETARALASAAAGREPAP